MSTSPEKNSEGLVTYSIYSEGNRIQDSFELISIHVERTINRIGRATLQFEAGDMPKKDIPESDDDTFAPGNDIRVEVGYNSDESILFEGMVISHNLEIPEDGDSRLIIECADYMLPTTLTRWNRYFSEKTDDSIIKEILGNYSSISPTVDSTSVTHAESVQYYCSDWDFILSRADANGLIVIPDGKKVTICKPKVSESAVLTVTYGEDLIAFHGELLTSDPLPGLNAYGWDLAQQKAIKVSAATPSLNEQGDQTAASLSEAIGTNTQLIQTDSCSEETELQSWADSQLLRAGLSRIQGEIRFQGSSLAVPGCLIELAGLGKRFNGNAFIGGIEHLIHGGEWTTTAHMGLDAQPVTEEFNVVTPAASGLVPGIEGLHIGVVTKLDSDPAKENRIQVEIPILNSEKNLVWARMATFWANPNYGGFFIPDVGDEVILGFLNNDPSFPVILGSMYSSSKAPPYTIDEKNNIQAIKTKSGVLLEMDDEKKVVTITTPQSNKLVLSDDAKSITMQDQNGNKIELSDSGILIQAAKELTLKSGTAMNLTAGTDGSIKASSALNMKGLNVELSADASLTAKGNATAELSASGQTTVKGAMVMIN